MRKLKFYGASDDLVEIEGTNPSNGEPDEIGWYNDNKPCVVSIKDDSMGDGMLVMVGYAPAGAPCWYVGVSPIDENAPFPPDWSMEWSFDGYSTVLELEVGDNAVVRQVS